MLIWCLKVILPLSQFVLGLFREKFFHKRKGEINHFITSSITLLLLAVNCILGWKCLALSCVIHFIANKFVITGITGGMGSGKSTLGDFLSTHGWTVIDSDKVAKSVLDIGTNEYWRVFNFFGPKIVESDGQINRALLRKRVFDNPSELKFLTDVMRWSITKKILWQIFKYRILLLKTNLAIESPLLFNTPLKYISSPIVLINAPIELRINRCAERDKQSSVETIRNILKFQNDPEQLVPLADVVIENDGSKKDFLRKSAEIFKL